MVRPQKAADIVHPKLGALFDIWRSKSRNGRIPARADFDVTELKPWLGNLALLDVVGSGEDFVYRVHGLNLVKLAGLDLTGVRLSTLPAGGPDGLRHYRQVWRERSPLVVDGTCDLSLDRPPAVALLLPLAQDGQSIDKVLTGTYGL